MCSPDRYYVDAYHIVQYPILSEMREYWGFNYIWILCVLVIILLIFCIIFLKSFRSFIIPASVLFLVCLLGIGYFGVLNGCQFSVNYYTDDEFIDSVHHDRPIWRQAIFYKGAKLDLTGSDFTFTCKKCDGNVTVTDKTLTVHENTEGYFVRCDDSTVIDIYIFGNRARDYRREGSTYMPQNCIDN